MTGRDPYTPIQVRAEGCVFVLCWGGGVVGWRKVAPEPKVVTPYT